MADLVLREQDGWEELEHVLDAIRVGYLEVGEFWSAVARGSTKVAVGLLEDAGYEFDRDIAGIRAYYEPDDIHGELLRVWVKFK
jgi:hypothetical protein